MSLNEIILRNKDQLIEDILHVVKFESVKGPALPGMPEGEKVNEVLETVLALGEERGFKTRNLGGHSGYIEYGEGEDYVAVLGHLDVVPVGEGWTKSPQGEISGDKIYGRGTMDDKGPMMAAFHGLMAIKEENLKLTHRIRLIFGTSEETGGDDIRNYLKTEKQPISGFTPDAEFPAIHAEMGILVIKISKEMGTPLVSVQGGQAVNMVPDYAYATFMENGEERTLRMDGVSAHGSTPEKGKNAISMLLSQLVEEKALESIKDTLSVLEYNLCRDLDGKNLGVDFRDDPSGKLILNTGIIKLEEGKLETYINIRYPVTIEKDQVITQIEKTFRAAGFTVDTVGHDGPLYYEKSDPMIKKLMAVYEKETGDQREPLAIGGGTYAKMMKNIVAFGPQLPGREDTIHQLDEYAFTEDLLTCAKIYAHAMAELAK